MDCTEHYQSQDESTKILSKLMLDLGTYQDKFYLGTRMGGNPSQWWFLVNHPVSAVLTEDVNAFWSAVGSEEIILHVPEKPKMKQIRETLNEFYSQHPHRLEVTEAQLINPSFLRDQPVRHMNSKNYILAIEVGLELQKWLDLKIELNLQITSLFAKEKEVFEQSFLQEKKLPSNYFDKLRKDQRENSCPFKEMYHAHPVWGAKLIASDKRYQMMLDQLISQDDLDKIAFINSCPIYITLAVFRRVIQIERIIRLNLDERKEFEFMETISKIFKEIE